MNEGAGSATLWIASGSSGVDPETSLLGLPLVSRAALAGERSGFARIVVEEPPGRNWSSLLAGTRAEILRAGDPPPAIPPGRLIVLLTRVVAEKKWLKELRQIPAAPDRIEIDPGCAAVLETDEPARAAALLRGRGAENALDAVARSFGPAGRLSSPDRFEIAEAQDLSRAEKWMLARLVKDTEGFMSRHVERRISLALSRRLSKTRVTPNAMTLVSVGVGLAGAALFLSPSPWVPLTGALLVLTHSILDGCDGELARLKFQESRFGGVLDFWGDNVVHSAVFSAIAIAWARAAGQSWPLLLGASAVLGTILSAAFVYRSTMMQVAEGPLFTSVSRSETAFAKLVDALGRRDFLYLIVLLAAFHQERWFLVLAAAGSPVYFFLLLLLARGERRGAIPAADGAAVRAVRVDNSGRSLS